MKSWLSKIFLLFFSLLVFLLVFIFLNISYKNSLSIVFEIDLLFLNYFSAPVIFLVDSWSMFFSITVLLISFSVYIFSFNYMMHETHPLRFHLILMLFVSSMLILIFSPGLVSLFLGWDGLGLSSFLLVIYYSNMKSLNAGMLTFLTNRLGDGLLLAGAGIGFWVMSFNIYFMGLTPVSWVFLLLLLLGAITKSAQIPFSAWLPAAMAAPTPVSSLVHSSTLVTAGVYLLFRLFDIFSSGSLFFLFSVGSLTMMLASLSALMETDMKKIIALSTLSQLGLMVVALGLGQPQLSFFHLITHAFFKALMFIGVGTVMHMEGSYQDLKVMGNSASHPMVLGILIGANFSLGGLPFFSGFFSKESILLIFSNGFFSNSMLIFSVFLLSVILTQLYSIRFFVKVSLLAFYYKSLSNYAAEGKYANSAMSILLIPAIASGSLLSFSWGLSFESNFDSGVLKFFMVSLFSLSLLFSYNFFSSSPSKPVSWWMFNMWLLPWFSSSINSKNLIFYENSYFSHLMNFFDFQLVCMMKLMVLKMKKYFFLENLSFFEIVVLSLLLLVLLIM